MLIMKELLENTQIYESEKLQNFLLELETRYQIVSAQKQYRNLVNFSANAKIPFHQWFVYREGFAGELITELIKMSGANKGECIIDPFCGSGTTNVVSVLNGFHTLGLDVNPMSSFITNAKIDSYCENDLSLVETYILKLHSFKEHNFKKTYEDIRKYFNDLNFNELVRIKTYLDTLPNSKSKNLMIVAFNSIIIDCSDRKRDGNGLKTRTSKVTDVELHYCNKLNLLLTDVRNSNRNPDVLGFGIHATAYDLHSVFNCNFQKIRAGAIIFSPPYANSFDYFESYKLELVFGDYADGMKGINQLRERAVRSFIGAAEQNSCDVYVDLIAKEIELSIPIKESETGKRDARTRKVPNMIRGYFSDMNVVLEQCAKTLPSGRKTYIVVDQSAYCGKIVPTDIILAYLGEQNGFTVGKIIECRKARTSTQQLNKYPYLKNALRESIVELIKN